MIARRFGPVTLLAVGALALASLGGSCGGGSEPVTSDTCELPGDLGTHPHQPAGALVVDQVGVAGQPAAVEIWAEELGSIDAVPPIDGPPADCGLCGLDAADAAADAAPDAPPDA